MGSTAVLEQAEAEGQKAESAAESAAADKTVIEASSAGSSSKREETTSEMPQVVGRSILPAPTEASAKLKEDTQKKAGVKAGAKKVGNKSTKWKNKEQKTMDF